MANKGEFVKPKLTEFKTHRLFKFRSYTRLAAILLVLGVIPAIGGGVASVSGASTASGLKLAQEWVAAHSQPPTVASLGFTSSQALTKPPKHEVIDYPIAETGVNQIIGQGIAAAAKVLGWTVKVIPTGATPESVAAAWNQMVADPPNGIITTGNPDSEYATQLTTLVKDHVAIVNGSVPNNQAGQGIVVDAAQSSDYRLRGKYEAEYIIAKSHGHAKVAYYNVPEFPVLLLEQEEALSIFKSQCPACTINVQAVPITAVGTTLPAQVVNYLEGNPTVNWLMMGFGDMDIGVPSALSQAGIASQVKMVSQADGPTNFGYIANNQVQVAAIPEGDSYYGWMMMDALAEHFAGDPIDTALFANLPHYYATASNIKNSSAAWAGPAGFQAMFEKLWKG